MGLASRQGRWQNERSLAYYLQEALVRRLLASLPKSTRAQVALLPDAFEYVIFLYRGGVQICGGELTGK